jgi:hypothetical protein
MKRNFQSRCPRIASYLIHNSRGGSVVVTPRNPHHPSLVIDTTPKHAKAIRGQLVGRDGIVLPIRRPAHKPIDRKVA